LKEFFYKSSTVAEMGNRLDTTDIGRKVGGCFAHFRGGAAFPPNTTSPRPRPTSVPSGILIHPAVWPQQTWAENRGLCRFGGAGSPSNTVSPWPRPTSLPSGMVIQPFGHNRHGLKIGAMLLFWGEGELGPHIMQCGLRRCLTP